MATRRLADSRAAWLFDLCSLSRSRSLYMSGCSPPSSSRWLAYDARAGDADNSELEPTPDANTRQVRWTDERKEEGATCRWSGVESDGAPTTPSTFGASSVPQRTLTFVRPAAAAEHTVYFLPRAFLHLPAALVTASSSTTSILGESSLASLVRRLLACDSISGDAYTRFRFVWMCARDATRPQTEEEMHLLTRHTNLFAPITTHDHKAFVRNVLEKLTPPTKAAAASTTTPVNDAETAQANGATAAHPSTSGLLPQIPFACDLSDPHAMLAELLATLVHGEMCRARDWNLDATTWTSGITSDDIGTAWQASCDAIFTWLSTILAQRRLYLSFVARCYRELMPAKTLVHVMEAAFPFAWKDPFFQSGLVQYVLADGVATRYPPSIDHRLDVWRTLTQAIEADGALEVHADILQRIQEWMKVKAKMDPAQLLETHWTVTYRADLSEAAAAAAGTDNTAAAADLQTCTLKMESGFSSTTGCSLWPAGMLMCEFILAHRAIFEGKRVLELGVGIGLTTIMLHRAGVSTLICTDCDDKALRNLRTNFEINNVPVCPDDHDDRSSSSFDAPFSVGVHVVNLDWQSADRARVLARCRPDIVIACDTIYLPELHDAQGRVVLEGMKCAATSAAASSSSPSSSATSFPPAPGDSSSSGGLQLQGGVRYPCTYFAQMNRNPETFAHYLATFRELGLHVESQTAEAMRVPRRFAYDRQAIEFHRFTLQA